MPDKNIKYYISYVLSLFIWGIWWSIAIIIIIISLILTLLFPKKMHDPIGKMICVILVYSAFIFPRIKGVKTVSLPFPAIFVSNHVSIFDLFISGAVFPGYPRGLELKKFFSLPVYGWLITRFGNIPIDPGHIKSVKESFNKLSNILVNKERNIIIMPEGKRTTTGKVDAFKPGAFLLSMKTKTPIVPVVFKGLFDINNKTSILIKPGFFDVIFLEPVFPENFNDEYQMSDYVRNLIVEKLGNKYCL
jgi:1-acyl-sn-glycerol-3-phosphate acyltransferase